MFQFSNGLPVRQTIRFGQSRILCSQNTFFVFAKHVFCVRKTRFLCSQLPSKREGTQ